MQATGLDCVESDLLKEFRAKELYLPLIASSTAPIYSPQSRHKTRELRVVIIPSLLYDASKADIWPPASDDMAKLAVTADGWTRDIEPRDLSFISIRLPICFHGIWRWVIICVGEALIGRMVCDMEISDEENIGSREYLALQAEFQN